MQHSNKQRNYRNKETRNSALIQTLILIAFIAKVIAESVIQVFQRDNKAYKLITKKANFKWDQRLDLVLFKGENIKEGQKYIFK